MNVKTIASEHVMDWKDKSDYVLTRLNQNWTGIIDLIEFPVMVEYRN